MDNTRVSRMSFNEDIEMYSPKRIEKKLSPKTNNSIPTVETDKQNNPVSSTMNRELKNQNQPHQTSDDCYLTVTITVTQC